MVAVFACLVPILVIFTLLGLLDRRFPDRLTRRGRFLAGLPRTTAS
ncbi:MAG TPA: hypothetical protein VMI54_12435 [Polyangiaceae bacterium]|nr:hypothetical protein [Polyangiaceae bacterium]